MKTIITALLLFLTAVPALAQQQLRMDIEVGDWLYEIRMEMMLDESESQYGLTSRGDTYEVMMLLSPTEADTTAEKVLLRMYLSYLIPEMTGIGETQDLWSKFLRRGMEPHLPKYNYGRIVLHSEQDVLAVYRLEDKWLVEEFMMSELHPDSERDSQAIVATKDDAFRSALELFLKGT